MWISACGRVLFVVVVSFLRTCEGADAVLCVAMETCLLPCRFSFGEDLVIHWIQKTTKHNVHSFYHERDQLGTQDASFRGRTELFLDQIPTGNASLHLTRVTIQDQGTYRCYTGTNDGTKEEYVHLDVNAPLRRVNVQQVEDNITCSSEGIYPRPELTWSTRPPSNQSLQITTRVEQTPEQLYSISSSLTAPDADLDHICTVSSGGNNRTATWWQLTSIEGSESGATVPCRSLASHTQLTWTFNHSQVILNQTGTNHMVSKEWTRHVEGPSESINLTLKDLSSDQEGMYTCELSNTEETYVTSTFVMVQKSPGGEQNLHGT
ncbi:hhla2 [Pungitius sinensis]